MTYSEIRARGGKINTRRAFTSTRNCPPPELQGVLRILHCRLVSRPLAGASRTGRSKQLPAQTGLGEAELYERHSMSATPRTGGHEITTQA